MREIVLANTAGFCFGVDRAVNLVYELVDKNEKVWIYDWETAGERSVWYDAAVLQYSLRRHSGWADLFKCQKPEQMRYCDKNKQYSIEEFAKLALLTPQGLCIAGADGSVACLAVLAGAGVVLLALKRAALRVKFAERR